MRHLPILLLLLTSMISNAQSPVPNFEWAIHLNGFGQERIIQSDMKIDSENNIYIVGELGHDTGISFSSGTGTQTLISPEYSDATYLAKYDSDWNLIWAKSSSTGSMSIEGLAIDSEDNLVFHGIFNGDTDFQLGEGDYMLEGSAVNKNFIAKYNSDGSLLWVYHTEGTSSTQPYVLEIDNNDNIYQTGSFVGEVDFNVNGDNGVFTDTTPNFYDFYILKLDSNGGFQWLKQFASNSNTNFFYPSYLNISPSGEAIYIAGQVKGGVDFDPSPEAESIPVSDEDDEFFAKYTSDGELVWVKTLQCSGLINFRDFEVKSNGNLVFNGVFYETVDFDPSVDEFLVTSTNDSDEFLAEFNPEGGLVQAHAIYNQSFDPFDTPFKIMSIAIGDDDAIYIEGFISGSVDFNLGEGIEEYAGSNDENNLERHFYVKYDSSLNFQWFTYLTENQFGDNIDIEGFGIDSENSIISAGSFGGTLVFPDYSFEYNFGESYEDLAIIKFKQCDYEIELEDTGCEEYVWNGQTYTESGEYSQIFTSILGCDSTVTKNLLIFNHTASDTSISACVSYQWDLSGQQYFDSGTYVTTISNVNGCDSVITLNLSLQNESDTLTDEACNSYYWESTDLTYEESGSYESVFVNEAGCDSTLVLELSIFEDVENEIEVSTCDEYFWSNTNTTYSETGVYRDTLSSVNSCDSVVVLNLTILESTGSTIVEETCDNYTWELSGETYDNTGIYEYLTQNSVGCDSVIQLDLTIQNSQVSEEQSACESFFWPVNQTTYEESGTYVSTYTNQFGCDSIHELNLEIILVNTAVTVSGATLIAGAEAGDFQWLDCNDNYAEISGATDSEFSPMENGLYAVSITSNGCQDTSACYLINSVGVEEFVDKNELSLFPNPTMGSLYLHIDQPLKNARIQVFAVDGKKVIDLQSDLEDGMKLPIQIELNGIYIVSIQNETDTAYFRVIFN